MNKRRTAVILGLGAAATLLMSGCGSTQTTVSWQDDGVPRYENSTQDWWNYQCMYYPNSNVYFQPYSKMYYWCEDGVWRTGAVLPSEFTLEPRTVKVVKLSHDLPFLQHDSTVWRARPVTELNMPDKFVPVFGMHHAMGVASAED